MFQAQKVEETLMLKYDAELSKRNRDQIKEEHLN